MASWQSVKPSNSCNCGGSHSAVKFSTFAAVELFLTLNTLA